MAGRKLYPNARGGVNRSEGAGRRPLKPLSLRAMELGRLLKLFAIALAVVLPVRAWVAEPIYVASPSMEPTLRTGTLLVLDKLTLRVRGPRRGDVLSFRSPVSEHDLLKRVIALPG